MENPNPSNELNFNGTEKEQKNYYNFEVADYDSSFYGSFGEMNSNYSRDRTCEQNYMPQIFPAFENHKNVPPSRTNWHDNSQTSEYFSKFDISQHGQYLMGNNNMSQPPNPAETNLSTRRVEIPETNTSLISLFQKAIQNPEEKKALIKIFRQINIVEDADANNHRSANSGNIFAPPKREDCPNLTADNKSYKEFPTWPNNYHLTANSKDKQLFCANPMMPNPAETFKDHSGGQNISNEVVTPNIIPFEHNLSPNLPDSEIYDTTGPTSDEPNFVNSPDYSSSSTNKNKRYFPTDDSNCNKFKKFYYMQGVKKNLRRISKGSFSHSETSSLSALRCRRKRKNAENNVQIIDGNTIPSLFTKFPKYVGAIHLKNLHQPDMYHRARYLTEGSRTTLRDFSGTSYPTIKLSGYVGENARLHVFIGSEGSVGTPSFFYQISRATFKNCSNPYEMKIDGINVLEYKLTPLQDMTVILDGIGIIKLRNSDVEHRFGIKNRKKTSKCCLMYRAIVPYGELGYTVLQARSNSITCVQPMGNPEISKVIPPCAYPGNELAIIGKNFLKNAFILFYDNIIEADNPSGKKYSWSVQAVIDSDLSTPMHIVCKVPFYPEEYARANGSTNLKIIVRCNNRSSQPILFQYKNPNNQE